jgi:diphosphomevalonate decarboxylase
MGTKDDGTDSYAVEVAPKEHWPDMHALICVVSDAKKGVSSTAGMQLTVATSELLQHRIKHVVPARMKAITEAIKAKDFPTFATLTMQDSNQFHAVALDTFPPIFYMNDTSRAIVAVITEYNRASVAAGGAIKAAYTYDAGPNAVIYAQSKDLKEIINLICNYFPQNQAFDDPFKMFTEKPGSIALPEGFNTAVAKVAEPGAVSRLIHTRVGDGPRVLDDAKEALLNAAGMPEAV